MPHQCAYDPHASLARCRFTGRATGTELVEACAEFYGDARWKSGMTVIVDLTGVSGFIIDPEEMRRLVEAIAAARAAARPGRVIYAVPREDHYFAVQAFAAQIKRKGWETALVRSLKEVLALLGLEELPAGLQAA